MNLQTRTSLAHLQSSASDLPHDERAEVQLISLIALYPDYWRYVSHLSPADFQVIECAAAWLKLKQSLETSLPIDGADYLEFHDELYPVIPTVPTVLELANRIGRTAYARATLRHLSQIAQACYKVDADLIDSLMASPPRLSATGDTLESVREVASRLWDQVMNPEVGNAKRTGLWAFDQVTGGLERQTSTLLAARPSMGKSAALVQISDLASAGGQVVAVFSREMSSEQWLRRMACRRAHVSVKDLKEGKVSDEQRAAVANEAAELGQRLNLFIDGGAAQQTTEDVLRICERLAKRMGRIDLLIGDHARLFDDYADNETHRMGRVTWGWKRIAKALDTRAILAAQLNRSIEGQTDKRPDLKDLRDSGEMEENADNVVVMYRENYYNPKADKTAEFIARKARDGERNLVSKSIFLPDSMSFERGM